GEQADGTRCGLRTARLLQGRVPVQALPDPRRFEQFQRLLLERDADRVPLVEEGFGGASMRGAPVFFILSSGSPCSPGVRSSTSGSGLCSSCSRPWPSHRSSSSVSPGSPATPS